MIRAILFDMDGVLTDTIEYHYRSWQRLADEEGIPFNRDDNEPLRGLTRQESLRLFLKGRSITAEQAADWLERKNRYFHQMIEQMSPADLLPGLDNLLSEVHAAGLKIAVVSSSRNTVPVLTRLGLMERVDNVTDSNLVPEGKPAPDLFLSAARDLGVPAAECLVVEDSAAGIQAGKAAGMRTLGLGAVERVGAADVVLPDLNGRSLEEILKTIG